MRLKEIQLKTLVPGAGEYYPFRLFDADAGADPKSVTEKRHRMLYRMSLRLAELTATPGLAVTRAQINLEDGAYWDASIYYTASVEALMRSGRWPVADIVNHFWRECTDGTVEDVYDHVRMLALDAGIPLAEDWNPGKLPEGGTWDK